MIGDERVNFTVDGKILNELSKQVSSHLFALGELLKNSYDAQATEVKVMIDLEQNLMTISDNGTGISRNNIKDLLHIAGSTKQYAKTFRFNIDGKTVSRVTQGSKGLGLFSAFKFGNIVSWDTKTSQDSFRLTIDKEAVTELDDIAKIDFELQQGTLDDIGTTITILLDATDEDIAFIFNSFKNLKNSRKLVQFFFQNDITITLTLIDESGNIVPNFPIKTKKRKQLNDELLENKLFDIDYDSRNQTVRFTNLKNGREFIESFTSIAKPDTYTVVAHFNAYSLTKGGVNKINSIFHNSRDDLAPLVYINRVLLNNDSLFDPQITRKIQGSKTLPQLTGFVRISTDDNRLQFNNERTDLVKNAFNEEIRLHLDALNRFIQIRGKELSKLKVKNSNYSTSNQDDLSTTENPVKLSNENELNSSSTNLTGLSETQINNSPLIQPTNSNPNQMDLLSKNETENQTNSDNNETINFLKPFINLTRTRDVIKFDYQSPIIDLREYFSNASDSKGVEIKFDELKITVDDTMVSSPMLPIREENHQFFIKFSFSDSNMDDNGNDFIVSETLIIELKKRNQKLNFDLNKSDLLIKPIGFDYTFKLPELGRLISQINNLYKEYENYDVCIAASIRLIFDIATYEYERFLTQKLPVKEIENKVEYLIDWITSAKDLKFDRVTSLIDHRFSVVKNTFDDPGIFKKKVSLSNLGSHTGSFHLSKQQIEEIAKYAGNYAQLIDAYCQAKGFIR